MTRPAFLSRPGVWIRTPRTAQTPADYACAVEHNVRKHSGTHPAEYVVLAILVGFILSIIFWS